MDCLFMLALFVMYAPLIAGIKVRDRKKERREVELRHREWIEQLHLLHERRMKLIDAMSKAELDQELAEVEKSIEQLEEKALGEKPRGEGSSAIEP